MSGFIANLNNVHHLVCNAKSLAGRTLASEDVSECGSILFKKNDDVPDYLFFRSQEICVLIDGVVCSFNGNIETRHTYPEIVARYYLEGNFEQGLRKLNGQFVVIVVDHTAGRITVASDKFGIRPCYFLKDDKKIIGFANESRLLINPDTIEKFLDKEAIEAFVDIGHLLGTRTIFNNIERIAPASIYEFDLNSFEQTRSTYWSWREVTKDNSLSFDEATDKMHQLFEQAMKRTLSFVTSDKLSITLSGGLDSRVLLASAVNHFSGEIASFTFGKKGCDDAVIAETVAELANVSNSFREINQGNWLEGREQGITNTSGHKNVLHMHALGTSYTAAKHSPFLLNGYLGDVVLGGSYLLDADDSQFSQQHLQQKYQKYHSLAIDGLEQEYFNFACTDPIFLFNRGVRFIAKGSDLLSPNLVNLKPFLDEDLVFFSYSLPDSYRRNSKIYNAMLLKYYPDYFNTIPWQQTGQPISVSSDDKKQLQVAGTKVRMKSLLKKLGVFSIAKRIYHKYFNQKQYTNYTLWLNEPNLYARKKALLTNNDSYLTKVLGAEKVSQLLKDLQAHKPLSEQKVGVLISIELFLHEIKQDNTK